MLIKSDVQPNANVSVDPAYLKMLEDSWKKQQAQPDLQQQLNEQFAKVNERLDQLERDNFGAAFHARERDFHDRSIFAQ